jgi:hypothetical protein
MLLVAGRVFINYSRHDAVYVDRLLGWLEQAGLLSVWLDRRALGVGDQWEHEVHVYDAEATSTTESRPKPISTVDDARPELIAMTPRSGCR